MNTNKKPLRVLALWYQYGDNFGDVLIYETTRQIFENENVIILPYEVGRPCEEIIREANKCDFLLFAGGGIIERGIPNCIRYFKEDYHLLCVPYGVVGLSVGDFSYDEYAKELQFWIAHASFFYVRDHRSLEHLKRTTNHDGICESADVVFANKRFENLNAEEHCGNRLNRIGINVRQMPYEDLTGAIDTNQIEAISTQLGVEVSIPDCEYPEGFQFIGPNQYKINGKASPVEKVETTLAAISACDIVIAMRYHVVLCAAMMGRIPIPITYTPKVQSLAMELGIAELSVGIDDLQDIPQIIEYAKNNEARIRGNLEKRCIQHQIDAKKMYEHVKECIIGGMD